MKTEERDRRRAMRHYYTRGDVAAGVLDWVETGEDRDPPIVDGDAKDLAVAFASHRHEAYASGLLDGRHLAKDDAVPSKGWVCIRSESLDYLLANIGRSPE